MMDDCVMTSAELVIWRMIARDLGYEVDECDNPFRRGQRRDPVTGEMYCGVMDWSPLEDDADAFALMIQYRLLVAVRDDFVLAQSADPTIWNSYASEFCKGDTAAALRRAVFLAAGEIVKIRAQLDDLAS